MSRDPNYDTTDTPTRLPGRSYPLLIMGTIMVMVLIAAVVSGGCINKFTQRSDLPETTPEITTVTTPLPENTSARSADTTISPVSQVPIATKITPVKSEVVHVVAPIVTPDPYPVMHGTRINSTPLFNRLDRTVEFEKSYHLTGGANGLLVNVAEGPLYIVYIVTPQNDCLESPGSCKGDMTKPVQRPYMTITVRDNETHEIIAQDGYAREYSSDTGNYEFSFTSKSTMDTLVSSASYEEVTTTSSPGPRYIPIYKEGTFHITIEGAFVDADVKILTGAMPTRLDTLTSPGSTPVPSAVSPEEEEFW